MSNRPNIAVLASGSGTNFEAIALACQSGDIAAELSLLITNRPCSACERAENLGIQYKIINPKTYKSALDWDQAVLSELKSVSADWVVLAGFLKKIGKPIIENYKNKILNIHPALLPKFGGPGMYGEKVHQAVFDARESVTGSTIHIVNENFDEGPIVAQKKVLLTHNDTPETISQKVRSIENDFFVETLKLLINENQTSG